MRLHLVNDEKIINRTVSEFENVFPGANLWVVTNRRREFRLVEKRPGVIGRDEFLRDHARKRYDEIYIHLLNPRKISVLRHVDMSRARVYWIIWGLDLYNKLLTPKGFRLYAPGNSGDRTHGFRAWFRRMGTAREARRTIRFVERHVDYIVTDTTENDYDYLIRYYPQLGCKQWLDFFYYPIDVILGEGLMDAGIDGNDIMIGNSASATNNHERVIDVLSRLDTGRRRIVMPLSYSGHPEYVDKVSARGRAAWGDRFVPLLDFMPLDDYNRRQRATSVALFGNLRQEAIGNILVSLYLGAKVFMPRTNPVYDWAHGHGLTLFALEDLDQTALDTPLDPDTRARNRAILLSLYSRDRMHRLMRGLSRPASIDKI